MDIFSKKKRSEVMSRIRSTNTGVERLVFSYLRKQGIYFQRHYRGVKGTPDIALPRKKIAVFIDGDFWHGRNFKKLKPRLNKFWRDKIRRNMERDKRNRAALRRKGWRVMKVWESSLKTERTRADTLVRVANFMGEYVGNMHSLRR